MIVQSTSSFLLSRIARRAVDAPEQLAVIGADDRLDWATLWKRSGQLATVLQTQGVGPGDRVLLAVPRSSVLVVALLAVWRLRAAYVPLDPVLPASRLAWQAADCGARVVIAAEPPAWLPPDAHLVDPYQLASVDAMPVLELAEQAQTAYLIYTSGSTGLPKGVVVSHGALEAYLQGLDERLPQGISSAAHVSTPAADLGHTALFGALWNGWTLHLVDSLIMADPDAFADYMQRHRIDLLKIVPSHLDALMQASDPASALPERCLVLGGERASTRLAERVLELRPNCLIINHYGPTEATVGVLTRRGSDSRSSWLPLGRPLAHARVQVLDADGNAVPKGVAGELCIGGASLADGYLYRPALTADRFVPDPSGGGRRLYRSGDKVRQLSDSEFSFLGRLDDQIKIRGFRVEPEEVAARLRAMDAVEDALVIARPVTAEEGAPWHLLGYVKAQQALDGAALRAALAEQLPDYLWPVAVQVLNAWPLTANGKIDRAALPEPASERSAVVASRPSSRQEQSLLEIWQQVLRRDDLGIADNFFEVGGDSILSLQVIAKTRKLGLRLTPKQFFEHPTIAMQARVMMPIATSPELKAELDDEIWYRQAGVDRAAVEAVYPATPLQQGLLFHSMRDEQPGLYVSQLRLTLTGAQSAALDIPALRAAWQALIARHAVLRTRFYWPAGAEPLQIVEREVGTPFEQHDGRADTSDAYAKRYAALHDARACQGFAAEQAPLLQVDLFARPDGAYDLLWTYHHVLTDGWSTAQLLTELAQLYRASASGITASLPLPSNYRQYVAWLRRQPSTESFWRARFAALDEPARLAEALGAELRSYAAGSSEVLSRRPKLDRCARWISAAQGMQLTLNTLLQGAWALLLARLAGRRQALFGITVSGRPADWPQAQQAVGLFINSLPMWIELTEEVAPAVWLHQLQTANVELREVEHTPLTDLQRWSDRSGEMLFDSLLVFENYPLHEALQAGQAAFDVRSVEAGERTHYPLTLIAAPSKQGLSLQWRWDSARLPRATVARLAQHFEDLLDALAAADCATRLGDITLTAEPVRYRLPRYPFESVAERLQRQAQLSPEAPALLFEEAGQDSVISYGQLQAWSERIAAACAALNLGGEARIGVIMARSPALIATLLGVLRAGAVYVPLDPAYPDQRLRDMAADAGLAAVCCAEADQQRLVSLWPELPLIEPPATAPAAAGNADLLPMPALHPEQLAYIIYTSGSTGRPKGVGITQANLARLFDAAAHDYDFNADDVWGWLHEYTFDFSVWEIFGALVHGARLLIVPRDVTRDPPALHRILQQHGVSVLNQTPSAFAALSELDGYAGRAWLSALRYVIFGGEKLEPVRLADWWSRREAGDKAIPGLINMYGITETTVHVSFRSLQREDVFRASTASPIGRPLTDLSLQLFDAYGRALPPGAVGELHVGGAGLARGYLGRPGLTAERFVPDPYGLPGARLYRSGDLARRLVEGGLDYLGRKDGQLKVRGFRIEAGEIEAALVAHPEVRAAVVGSIDQRLIAWLLPQPAGQPAAADLRAFLATRLPAYMQPAAYVWLERLPMTTHGKLDRAALPPPEQALAVADYLPPRDVTESKLAAIWQQLLGVERVGADDDFFLLGGHSLLAMQVLASVQEAFGVSLPLRLIFEKPRLADLAAELHVRVSPEVAAGWSAGQVAQQEGSALSAAQERLWFLWKLEPRSAAYHINGAFELTGTLDLPALQAAYAALVARHPGLRLRFAERGGIPWQIIEMEAGSKIRQVDLAGAGERLDELLDELVREPFDLLAAPPLRCVLVRVHAQRHVLLLVLHHLIADDWSMGLLCRDFVALYRASVQREHLPPGVWTDPAYGELLQAGAEALDEVAEARQLAYWREQLAGEDIPLALPYDHLRRDGTRGAGVRYRVSLPAELTATLRRQAATQQATLFMNLLAVFQLLMYRYAGQRDIRIGVPLAGRDEPRLAEAVGFFVNTVVIRCLLHGGARAGQLLDAVREQLLAAHAHQKVPFARVIDALQPVREAGHTPLFQVLVNQRQNHVLAAELTPELHASHLEIASGEAQFDLMLNISETDTGALDLAFTYASDVFEADTIERLAGHYLELLGQWSKDLSQPLASFGLSDKGRGEAVPAETSHVTLDVLDRIDIQIAKYSEAIAVDDGETRLNYRQLEAWSAAIAVALRLRGVAAETRVGIAMPRSAGVVAALLGVLRAGAVYVPLDPDYPDERLEFVLADAAIALVLTDATVALRHAARFDRLQVIDALALRDAPPAGLERASAPDPQQLAYVIYTSGSTGRPKGVGISRESLARLFDASALLRFDQRDTWSWFHSYAFDFSVWEIFGALVHGGRLLVIPSWMSREPVAFRRWLAEHQVSVLNQTPSAFAQLMHADCAAMLAGEPALSQLRYVIFGGERLDPRLLADWSQAMADHGLQPSLVNMYGITETTVHVTERSLAARDLQAQDSVIGAPLRDLALRVLDADFNPVPQGASGELCVAGAGLARGYLGRPGLTAERFVPDPYGPPGTRLYRSGDVARRLPGGELAYLGRNDQQLKIRGFRIEPGEIQTALLTHPAVREALVLACESAGGKQLVAYLVAPGASSEAGQWHDWLAQQLPAHMLPAAFVILDRFPLTVNGKLDRKALPAPGMSGLASSVEPGTPLEQTLLQIWKSVLRREDLGIRDNFFAVGGDSILSLQVVAKMSEAGWLISPRQVFDAPTVAGLAALAVPCEDSAGPAAMDALELIAPVVSELDHGLVEDIYPATPMQAGMLYHALSQPTHRAYLNQLRVRLHGHLDVQALQASWRTAVERHAVLRTRFDWERSGGPWQVVQRQVELTFEICDAFAGANYQADLDAWCERDLERGFPADAAPLMRLALFQLGENQAELIWTHHHLLLDGWSVARVLAEVLSDYRARSAGRLQDIPPAPPYRDYVAWLQAHTDEAKLETWWKARFQSPAAEEYAGLLASLPSARGDEPGMQAMRWALSAEMSAGLRRAARDYEITLNTLMQGAWAMLLARYGHGRAVSYGTVLSGRPAALAQVERMLGLFVNSLPVWAQLPPQAELGTWLRELQANLSELRQYEHTPLAWVQQWTGRSGEALFDTLLAFENYPIEEALPSDQGTLQVDRVAAVDPTHYPLALAIMPRPAITLEWAWDGSRLDRQMVEQLHRHYTELLEQLVLGEERRVGGLRLSGGVELAPARRYAFRSLGGALSWQAGRTPQAVAVRCAEASLSYAELEWWSNRVARELLAAGVGAERRVGLCLERGVGLLAGLLGIMKSGGVLVPLDPDYPAARLAQMSADAGLCCVVTDAASLERHGAALAGVSVVWVGEAPAAAVELAEVAIHPQQLAYVLYTSGSTGRPKGVSVSQEALWTHLEDFQRSYELGVSDVVLHSSTINFDVCLHEILPALLAGSQVEMRGPASWTLVSLSDRLVRRGVTFARIPTALWQAWQREAPARSALRLRQVTVGGEALPGDALARWKAGPLSDIRLDNLYGPTETTIAALYRETEARDGLTVTVPIGRPYPGRTARVVDGYGDESPVGGLGELCLGGVTVARGYWGRGSQTAERFVPDPWGEPGSRLYRSGDLCRRRSDGTVDYIGRSDGQVKLRGQRIELGEIEAVLRGGAGVADAVVVVRGEGGHRRLAGYVTGVVDVELLRSHVVERLPGYMVPGSLTVLESLPRLANGKLDRGGLPAAVEVGERVSPRDDRERQLLAIWSQVLGRSDLGVTDNFFEVGGDSILSLQVVARAREAGLKLTPRQLFERPSVAGLAVVVEGLEGSSVVAAGDAGELPLTPIQRWFFERYPGGEWHWNQSVLLRTESLAPSFLSRAAELLEQRHAALRLRFVRDEAGAWHQHVAPWVEGAADRVWVRELDTLAALVEAGEAVQSSLDLAAGVAWRLGCFKVPGGWRVLVAIHHLAVDGVSWRILLDELQQVYEQLERGEAVRLPPASSSWSSWSRQLHDYAQRPERCAELAWWQTALAEPAYLPLFPVRGPAGMDEAPRSFEWQLDPERTAILLREAPRAYRMRVDEVLLAALTCALRRLLGRGEVILELEGHGREDVIEGMDLSRTLGWFTTQFPVRLPCLAQLEQSLPRIRAQLHSVPQRGLHWGLLAYGEDAASRTAMAALPMPEIGFNYLGRFEQGTTTAGRFQVAHEAAGRAVVASESSPDHALDIDGLIAEGSLALHWSYCPRCIDDEAMRDLVTTFEAVLNETLDHLVVAQPYSEVRPPRLIAVPVAARQQPQDETAVSWIERAELEASLTPPANLAALSVVALNALGAPRRLFLLPPGHGMAGEYRSLGQALNGVATVYALQSPWLHGKQQRAADFEALAEGYAARIRSIQAEGPYDLLGWSFGGRLAVAIADILARNGRAAGFIGIVDTATHWEGADLSREGELTPLANAAALAGSVLGAALQADIEHARLMAQHGLPWIEAEAHVWLALHNRRDSRRRMDWSRHFGGMVHEHRLEATHASIVHHPAFLASVRESMTILKRHL